MSYNSRTGTLAAGQRSAVGNVYTRQLRLRWPRRGHEHPNRRDSSGGGRVTAGNASTGNQVTAGRVAGANPNTGRVRLRGLRPRRAGRRRAGRRRRLRGQGRQRLQAQSKRRLGPATAERKLERGSERRPHLDSRRATTGPLLGGFESEKLRRRKKHGRRREAKKVAPSARDVGSESATDSRAEERAERFTRLGARASLTLQVRPRFLVSIALLAALAAAACRREPPPSAENLVVVTLDTLRADRLGIYGGEVATPHLDRIGRDGAYARYAISQVPLTRPSHLSLFTGRYPFEHGVRENVAPRFEATMPLLAEVLKEAGFRTAGFVSSIVLSSESGMDWGFETFGDDFGVSEEGALFLDSIQKRGDVTTEEAIDWLRENGRGRFFLWLHLYDPHDPYDPPEPFRSRYPERPYDGEVAFVDDLVGRLDSELERLGASGRTLLVVTSDHGEAFGEHGESGHGYFVYEPTLHVPWLFRGPGVVPGGELSAPVESVDLVPTVLEMLDLPPMEHSSGRSLAGALRGGPEPEPRPFYAESLMASLLYGWGRLVSVREGPWKLIEAPKPELYNLEDDPEERDNRIRRNAAAAERLRARLSELAPAGLDAGTTPSSEIAPELMEKLGALGYVGGRRGSGGDGFEAGSQGPARGVPFPQQEHA